MPIYRNIFRTFSIPVISFSFTFSLYFHFCSGTLSVRCAHGRNARKRYKLRILCCVSCTHSLCPRAFEIDTWKDRARRASTKVIGKRKFTHKSVIRRFVSRSAEKVKATSNRKWKEIYFRVFTFGRLLQIDGCWLVRRISRTARFSAWLRTVDGDEHVIGSFCIFERNQKKRENLNEIGETQKQMERGTQIPFRLCSSFRRSLRKCRASIHFWDFAIIIWLFGILWPGY